jgi:hypothetical protein
VTNSPHVEPQDDPLLTDYDLERLTGRARSTWQKARLTGDGPPFIQIGRSIRYPSSLARAWLSAHPRLRSTSDPGHTSQSGGAKVETRGRAAFDVTRRGDGHQLRRADELEDEAKR